MNLLMKKVMMKMIDLDVNDDYCDGDYDWCYSDDHDDDDNADYGIEENGAIDVRSYDGNENDDRGSVY